MMRSALALVALIACLGVPRLVAAQPREAPGAPEAPAGAPDETPSPEDEPQAPPGQKPAPGGETAAEPAGTRNPSVATQVDPVYPPLALEERVEAQVVLEVDIATDGSVDAVSVAKVTARKEDGTPIADPSRYEFGKAATIAGSQLEFTPALEKGVAIAVRVNYTYTFLLPKAPEPPPPEEDSAAASAPPPPPVLSLEGTVVERGTRSLVVGAKVTVYRGEGEDAEGYETTTDAQGHFEFFDLAADVWKVVVTKEGYIDFETEEETRSGEVVDARYYFEKGSYNPYDVTIEADRPKKEVNRRTLQSADIEKIPGTLGDPVTVVENLPGVARANGGQIIVRGSAPQDTGVFIDGSTVPLIYHFGGLRSVLPAKVIESIDFYPGNYSVAYGRAMGGVLDLHLKRLEPDRNHGSIDVSILDTSLYMEMPVGENAAIAIAGRRSYIDFVLDAALPEDLGLNVISAPRYYDYQLLGNWRPSPAHELRWLFLGSDDLFELVFDDAGDANIGVQGNDLSAGTRFQRLMGEYRYVPSERVKNRTKISMGRDRIDFSALDIFRLDISLYSIEARNTTTLALTDNLKLDLGLDGYYGHFRGEVRAPPISREGEPSGGFEPDSLLFSELDGDAYAIAPFAEASLSLGKLTLIPGYRVDYFAASNAFGFDPRLVARYDFSPKWALKGGAAVVHQEPELQDLNEDFGNPDLDLQRARQYSLGAEWTPLEFLSADVTLFYKDMRDLVVSSSEVVERDGMMVPERLNNEGKGRVYGAEVFLDHQFANHLRGWLSYTLSRAERRDAPDDDYRRFDFDQTHIFAAVATYVLPRNWEVGLRYRYVTGNPSTPIVGSVFVSDRDEYEPLYGAINSSRLSSFQQLDLRVDKTWIYDTWKLSAYLSLINATNHENAEGVNYNYDYSEKGVVTGLPIVPILGVKGEW